MTDELEVVPQREAKIEGIQHIKDAVFIAKVLDYVREHECSIPKACSGLGVSYRTFLSKCRKPSGKHFLEKYRDECIKQAAANVTAQTAAIIQRQVQIATEPRFLAKDATAAAVMLMEFRERHEEDLQETGTGAASLKAFKANFQPVVTPVQVNVNIDTVTVKEKAQND